MKGPEVGKTGSPEDRKTGSQNNIFPTTFRHGGHVGLTVFPSF